MGKMPDKTIRVETSEGTKFHLHQKDE